MRLVGVYLNKGRVLAIIIFIPMTVLMLFTEAVLLKLGMDSEACYYAGIFTYTVIPGFFFLSQFDCLRNYLNTMNKSSVIMASTLTAAVLHFFWCYIFIRVLSMGVRGASLATTITYFT